MISFGGKPPNLPSHELSHYALSPWTTMEALPWDPVIPIDNFWKFVAFAIP